MRNSVARKIAFIVAAAIFLFSGTMVARYRSEMRISARQTEAIAELAVTPVLNREEHTPKLQSAAPSSPQQAEDEKAAEESAAGAPITVDFDALFLKNQDVVAWLYCPDTPINYPVVQAADNSYYLRRLMDGSHNSAGTLFLDYRNAENLSDWNSVIYGHNMKNGSMFGSLPNYSAQSYFQEHSEIFLLTAEKKYVIQLVAGFTTPANSELYSAFAPDGAEAARLLEGWIDSSDFDSGLRPADEDRLITLSTCSYEYDNARYVLIGILKECE